MRRLTGTTGERKAERVARGDTVRVMQSMSDASRDYFLPRARAKELLDKGQLFFEVTNGCYHVEDGYLKPT